MIHVDGSIGEGGGQILRSALGLSLVTGRPFDIHSIRAGRRKPGLLRQHLTAVNAAVEISNADVDGNVIGSRTLSFCPHTIKPGSYRFAVGTAGSTTLVLQTILPALITVAQPSALILQGGTHNPYAPPFHFLERVFLPILKKMGCDIQLELERYGFYPAGGGEFRVAINPVKELTSIDILERGAIQLVRAEALVSNLDINIAKREIKVIAKKISCPQEQTRARAVSPSIGPGNIAFVEVQSEHITEIFTGFGEIKKTAERVGHEVANQVRQYLTADVPVGAYLADQLLIPFALSGKGQFRTMPLTNHTRTNINIVKEFLDLDIIVRDCGDKTHIVSVG
ncbi:MAG: RNA 3'-terminal phosphate cyclase [Candidatus Omnitrophica bacterium]|nr:RNA 3'-terminal phosphate cyclase [Candidatus Omnitrophota bacterium]